MNTVLWPDVDKLPDLTSHQRSRLQNAFARRIGILSGSPGTGKTFTAAAAIRQLVDQFGESAVAVCAPTGKAAVQLHSGPGPLRRTPPGHDDSPTARGESQRPRRRRLGFYLRCFQSATAQIRVRR